MATIKPRGEYVLLQPVQQEEKTAAGIYIPDTATTEKSQQGTVVAIGTDKEIDVAAGDTVLYKRYGGEEVTVDDTEYVLVKAEEIIATIA